MDRTMERSKRRKTGPKSWKEGKIPEFEVLIDFDKASNAWMANKVKLGCGEYCYKKRRNHYVKK